MNERERIGKRIAQLRAEKGYSTRELAERCGIHFSNIGKIERGAYNVSIDILSKITDALCCEINLSERTPLKQFICENQDRDDIVGDLCSDLLRDKEFLELTEESRQRQKIINVGARHPHIQDAVMQLFIEYGGEVIDYEIL